jgi:hypothetical protein
MAAPIDGTEPNWFQAGFKIADQQPQHRAALGSLEVSSDRGLSSQSCNN